MISNQNKLSIFVKQLETRSLMGVHDSAGHRNLNGYFSRSTTGYFSNLLKIFPLWARTNASSDPTMFAINHVQNNFDLGQKLTAIDFLSKHLVAIENLTAKGRKEIGNLKHKQLPKPIANSFDSSYLSYQENWIGKNNYEDSALHEKFSLNQNKQRSPSENGCQIGNKNLHMSWSSTERAEDSDKSFRIENHSESCVQSSDSENVFHSIPINKNKKRPKLLKSQFAAYDHHFTIQDEVNADTSTLQVKKQNTPKKSQYVTKFPAFKACHALKSKARVKNEIQIQSGCKLEPRQIDGMKFKIRESSVFDSLAEIFYFISKNFKGFAEYCDSVKCTNLRSCFFCNICLL